MRVRCRRCATQAPAPIRAARRWRLRSPLPRSRARKRARPRRAAGRSGTGRGMNQGRDPAVLRVSPADGSPMGIGISGRLRHRGPWRRWSRCASLDEMPRHHPLRSRVTAEVGLAAHRAGEHAQAGFAGAAGSGAQHPPPGHAAPARPSWRAGRSACRAEGGYAVAASVSALPSMKPARNACPRSAHCCSVILGRMSWWASHWVKRIKIRLRSGSLIAAVLQARFVLAALCMLPAHGPFMPVHALIAASI
jgi:hypothetical protein